VGNLTGQPEISCVAYATPPFSWVKGGGVAYATPAWVPRQVWHMLHYVLCSICYTHSVFNLLVPLEGCVCSICHIQALCSICYTQCLQSSCAFGGVCVAYATFSRCVAYATHFATFLQCVKVCRICYTSISLVLIFICFTPLDIYVAYATQPSYGTTKFHFR